MIRQETVQIWKMFFEKKRKLNWFAKNESTVGINGQEIENNEKAKSRSQSLLTENSIEYVPSPNLAEAHSCFTTVVTKTRMYLEGQFQNYISHLQFSS